MHYGGEECRSLELATPIKQPVTFEDKWLGLYYMHMCDASLMDPASMTGIVGIVRRQLPPRSEERATRQRRSDAKKRLAYRMAKRLRHPTHPSDSRSRGLPEQRASLRSALAPFLGKANATRGHAYLAVQRVYCTSTSTTYWGPIAETQCSPRLATLGGGTSGK